MSGPSPANGAGLPRVLVVEGSGTYDVFDVLEANDALVRVRSPFLFEIGEQIKLRLEHDGTVVDAQAVVRAHVERDGEKITELELSHRGEPRRMVTG